MSNIRKEGLRAAAGPHGAKKDDVAKSVAGPATTSISGNNTQRARGACNLCCRVFPIDELNKSAGQLCQHWQPQCRYGIYQTRPKTCSQYYCAWLLELVPDEFQPSVSHMVLTHDVSSGQLMVAVDPDCPNAWMQSEKVRDISQQMYLLANVELVERVQELQPVPLRKVKRGGRS
jgi:hypothetical protein